MIEFTKNASPRKMKSKAKEQKKILKALIEENFPQIK